MRRIIFTLVCVLYLGTTMGQKMSKDESWLPIRVVQPERAYITSDACRFLEAKMTQMLTLNGIVIDIPSNRFVMTSKVNVLSKDIIAGSPSRVSEQIELTLMIGDCIENKKYGTHTIMLTGVGLNENKALLMAFKAVDTKNAGIQEFISETKQLIINYYKAQELNIMRKADRLASEEKYEEACYILSLVPEATGESFERCQTKMCDIIKLKIDNDATKLLIKAKAIWAAHPNAQGASELYPLVGQIDSRAECYEEVQPFLNTITAKLQADEKQAWDFKMQQYQDQKMREQRDFEARQKDAERRAELRQQEINAARDVAKEYARHQPDVVNNIILW